MFKACNCSEQLKGEGLFTAKPKLHYFDIQGRAEITRLAFTVSGINFEDVRIPFAEWPQVRDTMLTGQCPMLEVGGEEYYESLAVFTYAAQRGGLIPEDPLHLMQMWQIILFIDGVKAAFSHLMRATPETQEAVLAKLQADVPTSMAILNEMVLQDQDKDGYCVGHRLSGADIVLFQILEFFKSDQTKGLVVDPTPYKALTKCYEIVAQHPKIRKYHGWDGKSSSN